VQAVYIIPASDCGVARELKPANIFILRVPDHAVTDVVVLDRYFDTDVLPLKQIGGVIMDFYNHLGLDIATRICGDHCLTLHCLTLYKVLLLPLQLEI
jgi:hypothetical protein